MNDLFSTPNTLEEDRLTAGWIEACRERVLLQAELDRPTANPLYEVRVKLWMATRDAGRKCNSSLEALRTHRKATLNANPSAHVSSH